MVKTILNSKYNFFIVLTMFLFWFTLWSVISVIKFYSLSTQVYDLGISMERLWLVLHGNWSFSTYIENFSFAPIVFLLSPLSLINSYPLLLIIQSFSVSSTIVLSYLIAKQILKNTVLSILISTLFSCYYLLSSILWYDFHFQAFFPSLFLTGFYLYTRKMYKGSVVFLVLSGLVRFPYPIFPALFAIIEISHILYDKYRIFGNDYINYQKLRSVMALFLISLFFLSIGYFYGGGYNGLVTNLHFVASNHGVSIWYEKMFTFLIIFTPLMFIPFLDYKSAILSMPFLYILFFSNNLPYLFPQLLADQYGSGVLPFIIMGYIMGINKILNWIKLVKSGTSKHTFSTFSKKILLLITRSKKNNENSMIKAVLASVIVIALLDLFFLPFGPLNEYSSNVYFSEQTNMNLTRDAELQHVLQFIPDNSSNVLIQDNLPQALPRPQTSLYSFNLVSGGFNSLGNNLTLSDVKLNQWPIITKFGNFVDVNVTYAIADLEAPQFLSGGIDSMFRFVELMLDSNRYGIVSEAGYFMLLERGYIGPIKYFEPVEIDFTQQNYQSVTSISIQGLFLNKSVQIQVFSASDNNPYWISGVLPPGMYFTKIFTHEQNVASLLNVSAYLVYQTGLNKNYSYTLISNRVVDSQGTYLLSDNEIYIPKVALNVKLIIEYKNGFPLIPINSASIFQSSA